MCIVLLTTGHPDYALIAIDNRDEFILRPTSLPHWWRPSERPDVEVFSSRDLLRQEKGTWFGITRTGNFAVLTNYKEKHTNEDIHPVAGQKSRGAMVSAWLGADPKQTPAEFARTMLASGDVKGMGGFSLICGKLRHSDAHGAQGIEPMAIISIRADNMNGLHWICAHRNETHGLSNTFYGDPDNVWPKVKQGEQLMRDLVTKATGGATSKNTSNPPSPHEAEEQKGRLVDALFDILDTDLLPRHKGMAFDEQIALLKHSIFIPEIRPTLKEKKQDTKDDNSSTRPAIAALKSEQSPDAAITQTPTPAATAATTHGSMFHEGSYGTQRQTVMLVDFSGNATYVERALWDGEGKALPRGAADVRHCFPIKEWWDAMRRADTC